MKKLVGLVIILTVLILGGYYGTGIITERTIKHNIVMINKSNGLSVNLVQYNRGWFKSNAILDWRLQVPEHTIKSNTGTKVLPAQDYEMRMPLTIYHGPIIFANNTVKFGLGYANTDIPVPDQYKEKFNEHFTSESTQPTLDLSLFITYLNNSQIELTIPAFKLIAKEGGQFDWMGMDSSVTINSNADKVKGDLSLTGMQFRKDNMVTIVGEITSDYDLHKTSVGLYLGDANITLPSLVVNDRDKKVFELNDLDVHSSSDIDDGLFNMHFKTTVDKLINNDKKYGPGTLEIAIRNLDAVVLGHINEQINNVQQGSDLEKQKAFIRIMPEIPKLLSRGPEFEISELSLEVPEGTVEGNLSIALPASDGNPLELFNKITGKGKLRMPGALLKLALNQANQHKLAAPQQAIATAQPGNTAAPTDVASTGSTDLNQQAETLSNSQLQSLVQTGFLVQDGDYYAINVVLKNGKLEVNGKPFESGMIKI